MTAAASSASDHPTANDRGQYDPTGEAAIWEAAARVVMDLRRNDDDPAVVTWNAALDQAARQLEKTGRFIKQGNGMYYRPLNGQRMPE